MDNKKANGSFYSLLPQCLQGSTSASESRSECDKILQQIKDNGYVIVPSSMASSSSSVQLQRVITSKSTEAKSGDDSKADTNRDVIKVIGVKNENKCTGKQLIEYGGKMQKSRPAPKVNDDTEEGILRKTLRDMIAPTIGVKKHFVMDVGSIMVTNTEVGAVLNNIAVGTTYSTRVGPLIRAKFVRVRGVVQYFSSTVTATANTIPPMVIRIVLKRTLVPTAAGSAEVTFATDANPPGTDSQLFSFLGTTSASDPDVLRLAVFNPASTGSYEFLREAIFPQIDSRGVATECSGESNLVSGAVNSYSQVARRYYFQWDVPLHEISSYDVSNGSNCVTNMYDIGAYSNFDDTNQNVLFSFSSEFHFEDVNSE